jgi:hypothetical protein
VLRRLVAADTSPYGICFTRHTDTPLYGVLPDTSLQCSGSRPQTSRIPDIATQLPLCTAFPAQSSLAARPNSYLPYPLLSNERLPISAANVLNTQGIAELLRDYPNQRFMDTLVSIAISGVQGGYTGSLSGQSLDDFSLSFHLVRS